MMIKALSLCAASLWIVSNHSLERRLTYADAIFERALEETSTIRDFEMAAREYKSFERDFEVLLKSNRVKRMRDLLQWVECDRIARNWLEARLQKARMRMEGLK
jgi:hypothetical protein